MKKTLIFSLIVIFLFMATAIPMSNASSLPKIYINGEAISSSLSGALIGGTSYLPIKAVADAFGGTLSWNASTRTAYYKTSGLEITAGAGNLYILANGRALYASAGIFIQNGRLMIPSRAVANCFGGSASWDGASRSVYITSGNSFIQSGDSFYNSDNLWWLSCIISSESQGEPMTGQIAVGNVILNRVKSAEYPNTIYGVIFDRNYGVQFEPVLNGTIYDSPADSSVIAAKLCLEGVDLSGGSLYFYNPTIAQSNWIGNNCTYIMTIGTHKFYV
ncbi:MAG: cell wall hydrolase [Clostridiaceae bacterium]|nr:cell wall hydrolase [Clostridiaceae bacterium]